MQGPGAGGPGGPEARRTITVIRYDQGSYAEESAPDIKGALDRREPQGITWIIISGHLSEGERIVLEKELNLHPVVADELIPHPPGRPKIIDLEDSLFVSWRKLRLEENHLYVEQINNLLSKGLLITQCPTDCQFHRVKEDARNERSRLRKMGADYLLFSIIDSITDDYFLLSEKIGEMSEDIQDRILAGGGRSTLVEVQRLRRMLIVFRQSIWPVRETLNLLTKGESDLIDDYTSPYFREVYDHTVELMDTIDTHRDMISEMIDVYQTGINNELSRVVKVLTIIAVIFSPLTFFTSIFSMNFRITPVLDLWWGFPAVILTCLTIAIIMLIGFRLKRWY